ncbi:prephenate dehydratase [Rhodococcus sp. NPDC019627]|uniref:prephenate dehydratase n=1 Tax=Rhodococcus TaxID=1827 RepID=UPI00131FBA8A|nr:MULTISPECIES: prephenate dehydratase [Rhodococcus]MDV7357408.1 prephenate dehydratase [Rhodococcus oxybenzonivorans]QHE66948.1 Prephenate dehydratase [Rhodococcus sp. WAY2]
MPKIAYFGPSGTFTEMALAELEGAGAFDGPVERVAASSPPATLELVRDGVVDGAVVPIESSVEGAVVPTLDSLALGERLQIVAETELDVAFEILGRPGIDRLDQVRTVRAYPVAAGQVRTWLEKNCPDAEIQTASSNAGAAEDVSHGLADAAVSTALAGRRLGLHTLASSVADVAGARTRFVLVTAPTRVPPRTGSDRSSAVLQPDNEPGSLVSVLSEFATRGIDLIRIESRPVRTEPGSYRFFVDCIGHLDDPLVAEAFRALHRKSTVRFLGSWPAANPSGPPPPSDGDAADWIERIRQGDREL